MAKRLFVVFWKDGLLAELQARMTRGCRLLLFLHNKYQVSLNEEKILIRVLQIIFQIRVVHGKEPPHFMAMFGGQLVIFAGGKAGWGEEESTEGPGDTYLLQVRGTSTLNCKAEQVGKNLTTILESNRNEKILLWLLFLFLLFFAIF